MNIMRMSEKCKLVLSNVENNIVEERSILKELLSKPNVDSQILKHVFDCIKKNRHNMEKFLKMWRKAYFSMKKPFFDEMVNSFYDVADGETFENFINTQIDNYSEARALLAKEIDFQLNVYAKSNNLDTSAIEKMLALLIASDSMPMNFFLIFNYACSKECELVDLKTEMLNGIYDMQPIGYNPEVDKVFFALQ